MRRPCRKQEIIVRQRQPTLQAYGRPAKIAAHNLIHQHLNVFCATKNSANRLGDISGRQNSESDLIEKRLKRVMVAAIYQNYVDR